MQACNCKVDGSKVSAKTGIHQRPAIHVTFCHLKVFPINFQLHMAGCQPLQSTSVEGHGFQDISKSRTRLHKTLTSWLEYVGITAINAKPEPCDPCDVKALSSGCFVS